MSKTFLIILVSFFSLKSFATVSAMTEVFILSQDDVSGEYYVQKLPLVGCFGLAKGPQLEQVVSPYFIPSNVGCGVEALESDINVLSCAKISDLKESADHSTFSEVRVDISECPQKYTKKFRIEAYKVIKMNLVTDTNPRPKIKIREN